MRLTALTVVFCTPVSVGATTKGLATLPVFWPVRGLPPLFQWNHQTALAGAQQETVLGPRAPCEVNKQFYTFSHKTPEEQFQTVSQHLKKKKSHSFLTKLLSVWGSDISKGQFTNKLGFFWQTELLLGVLLIISWPCLKKKRTKTNKPKENTLVWLHKQKGPQANARQQGACRSYKAT